MVKNLSHFVNMAFAVLMILAAGTMAQNADFGSCPSVREASQNNFPEKSIDSLCPEGKYVWTFKDLFPWERF